MTRLVWKDLLSEERTRPLLGGPPSLKSEKEKRTEFERDYGRTIYSAPFRRLKQKAQVFPLEPSDYVRTRLIHSQEVSSVAEDVAFQITRAVDELQKVETKLRDAIPLVAATCGLIHDLGNPPFGHAGELAISSWFDDRLKKDSNFLDGLSDQQKQDFLRFEGNAHTVRIISHLFLLADHYGLNYTSSTFSAARKYLPASHRTKAVHSRSKPGHFSSEQTVIDIVGPKTGTLDSRHPLAILVEAADDMVYCVVDLEDGIKRKVLEWRQVEEYLRTECSGNRVFDEAIKLAQRQIEPAGFSGPSKGEAMAQAFRIAAISEMAIAAKEIFAKRYEEIMDGHYDDELLLDKDCEAMPLVRACKTFGSKYLYTYSDILKLEIRGRRVIHDLMDLFWEAVENLDAASVPPKTKDYPGKLYHLISDNYRRVFEKRLRDGQENAKYCKLQLVTDYIAGMTDPFACRLHKDLING
jgi:dGTPase